jgi:hypothetical protein
MKQTLLLLAIGVRLCAQDSIPTNARLFTGNEARLAEAIRVKAVPVVLVPTREGADYELTTTAEGPKAGRLHIPLMKVQPQSVQVQVTEVRTKTVVFQQALRTSGSTLEKRRAAAALASDLDRHIRQGGRRALAMAVARDATPSTATSMRITSAPSYADLEVDGVFWGVTPTAELTRLKAGPHVIVVKKPGYQRWEKKVELAVGQTVALNAELIEAEAVIGRSRVAGLD